MNRTVDQYEREKNEEIEAVPVTVKGRGIGGKRAVKHGGKQHRRLNNAGHEATK